MENNSDKANQILKELEMFARKTHMNIVGPGKGKIIAETINRIKPKCILEIGTLFGYSTILMAKELEPGAKLITIERDQAEAEDAEENLKKAEIVADVEIYMGEALEILPKLRNKFDLVLLDASKSENMDYLRLLEDKLHKGSVLIADDAGIMANQMEDYLKYVRLSGRYESKYVPVEHDGMEISVKK